MNDATTLLNILTALTMLVPPVPADEMTHNDVLDAKDAWESIFVSVSTREWLRTEHGIEVSDTRGPDLYLPDGRELRIW